MTINDISGEHVSSVRIGVAEEVGEAHGGKRVIIVERAFIELDHDRDNDLVNDSMEGC